MAQIRRILYASDFSAASRAAFVRAVELARALKAELLLMHSLVPSVPSYAVYNVAVDWDLVEEAARRSAQGQLDRLARAARKAGLHATTLLAEGHAADQILQAAKVRRAGLIVLGTHGRTGLSQLVMGSVAARVAPSAPCPVMTVRGRPARRRRA